MSTRYCEDLFDTDQVDYYDMLGVDSQAGQRTIEAAYRRMALQFHPDHNPAPWATEQMQALNQAFSTLRDPARRRDYDCEIAEEWYGNSIGDFYSSGQDSSLGQQVRQTWGESKSWARTARFEVLIVILVALAAIAWLVLSPSQTSAVAYTEAALPNPSRPVNTAAGSVLFQDDFDNGPARWSLQAPWHFTSRVSASGMYSLWMGNEDNGRYKANMRAVASLKNPIELSSVTRPVLRLRLKGQSGQERLANGEDRLLVEVRTTAKEFETVYSATGLIKDWQEIKVDLSGWSGQSINLRLTFMSGSANSGAGFSGFFVDDIKVEAASN